MPKLSSEILTFLRFLATAIIDYLCVNIECHDFKGTIFHELQRTVLNETWEKYQKSLIAKGNQRRSDEFRAKEDLDQRLNMFRQNDSIRQQQLDERTEDLQARFSDISTALQFDTNRIDQKLASMIFKGEAEAPCLASRTKVAVCFRDAKGSSCDDYVKELERCVKETVVLKKQ